MESQCSWEVLGASCCYGDLLPGELRSAWGVAVRISGVPHLDVTR